MKLVAFVLNTSSDIIRVACQTETEYATGSSLQISMYGHQGEKFSADFHHPEALQGNYKPADFKGKSPMIDYQRKDNKYGCFKCGLKGHMLCQWPNERTYILILPSEKWKKNLFFWKLKKLMKMSKVLMMMSSHAWY